MPFTNPIDDASYALEKWLEKFDESWSDIVPLADASYPDLEEARRVNEINAWLRPVHDRLRLIYRTILGQSIPQELRAILDKEPPDFAETPPELRDLPLDFRRIAVLLPRGMPWLHDYLDALFLEDILAGLLKPAKRAELYDVLLLAAVPGSVSPIAAWYLARATTLLLLGLHPECVAVSRAVLEAALRFRLDPQELERVHTRKQGRDERGSPDYTLANLCWGAERVVPFTQQLAEDARLIRIAGNEVLHPDSAERLQQVTAIRSAPYVLALARLLRAIFPVAGGGA